MAGTLVAGALDRTTVDHTITVTESQLDWLTCSCSDPEKSPAFRALGNGLIETERDAGGLVRAWKLHNYWGFHCGRAGFGTSGESAIVALSGDLAERAFSSFYPLATNFSRLDAAVTIRISPDDTDLGEEAYAIAEPLWLGNRRTARPLRFKSPTGRTTFYSGKRRSECYLRLYDKAGESGDEHYRDCWRYEVESKETLARSLAVACAGSVDRSAFCQGFVHDKFLARSIPPWFDPGSERMLVRGFRRRSDTDTKLAWLRRAVAPSVRALREAGLLDDVRGALEL